MAQEQTSKYVYAPLQPGFIRLLRILPESTAGNIHCRLIHRKLEASEQSDFAALSYCWYDPTPVGTISVSGKPLGVAQNLLDFLQNRFLHGGRGMLSHESEAFKNLDLWIDAICINQTDDEEKSEQVHRMWQIYSTASLVIAWLGKEKGYTEKAFFALNTSYVGRMTGHAPPEFLLKRIEESRPEIVALTDDPYFSRTWIVQEVTCADQRIMLHSGRHVAYFESLYPFSAVSKGRIATQGEITARIEGGLNICAESLLYVIKRTREAQRLDLATEDGRWTAVNSLIASILDHKYKRCFDVRDKLFAFRGMPTARRLEDTSSPLFEVDYSMTLDEVAVATLSYIDMLDSMVGIRYMEYASLVVTGLFHVDIASDPFRLWCESKIHRDEERGTVEMVTGSGKRINCSTPFFERLLKKDFSGMTMLLTGRNPEDVTFEGRRYKEEKTRDPKKFTAFPSVTTGETEAVALP